jgi:uncharacterized protein
LKLHQDASGALNTVTGYGADYVEINLVRHSGSLLVLPEAPVIPWPVSSFDQLSAEHFAMLVDSAPEVVVFGSGERLRFPHPRLTAALTAKRIGVETMDFKAACRTYNILMAEGRKVAAALLIEAKRRLRQRLVVRGIVMPARAAMRDIQRVPGGRTASSPWPRHGR